MLHEVNEWRRRGSRKRPAALLKLVVDYVVRQLTHDASAFSMSRPPSTVSLRFR
jgi:hypothetical protein